MDLLIIIIINSLFTKRCTNCLNTLNHIQFKIEIEIGINSQYINVYQCTVPIQSRQFYSVTIAAIISFSSDRDRNVSLTESRISQSSAT